MRIICDDVKALQEGEKSDIFFLASEGIDTVVDSDLKDGRDRHMHNKVGRHLFCALPADIRC